MSVGKFTQILPCFRTLFYTCKQKLWLVCSYCLCLYENSHIFWHAFQYPFHTHKKSDWSVILSMSVSRFTQILPCFLTSLSHTQIFWHMCSYCLCLYAYSHRCWHAFWLQFQTHKNSDIYVHIVYVCIFTQMLPYFLTSVSHMQKFCSYCLCLYADSHRCCHAFWVPFHTHKNSDMCSYCLCLFENSHRFWHAFRLPFYTHRNWLICSCCLCLYENQIHRSVCPSFLF